MSNMIFYCKSGLYRWQYRSFIPVSFDCICAHFTKRIQNAKPWSIENRGCSVTRWLSSWDGPSYARINNRSRLCCSRNNWARSVPHHVERFIQGVQVGAYLLLFHRILQTLSWSFLEQRISVSTIEFLQLHHILWSTNYGEIVSLIWFDSSFSVRRLHSSSVDLSWTMRMRILCVIRVLDTATSSATGMQAEK